jgi:uncharacterized protein
VEKAEAFLHTLGLRECRVRFHDTMARIEANPADFPFLIAKRLEIIPAFRELGFKDCVLDLVGFRSGSLNEVFLGSQEGTKKN